MASSEGQRLFHSESEEGTGDGSVESFLVQQKSSFRTAAEQVIWRDEKKVTSSVMRCHLASLESVKPAGGLK